MTNQEFIEQVAKFVQKYAAQYGIKVHSPIIAQAILESGWGNSKLAARYHNYFGLKCGTKWTGKSVNMTTQEEYTGDVILYDWDDNGVGDCTGWSDHVGIVVSVSGSTIKVIEGNKNDSVGYRNIAVNSRYIRGFITPKFSGGTSTVIPSTKKSVDEVAKEVLAGAWGNGDARKNALTAAGYNYSEVQAAVNRLAGGKTTTPTKSITEVAKEVLAGKWGNGDDRKKKLEAAGYNYSQVQAKVNELAKGSTSSKKSVTQIAKEVIAGKWGNGTDRKNKLTAAGYDYTAVQKEVNRLL